MSFYKFTKEKKSIQDTFNLAGKVVIVTGASMGMGKGAALRLAEAGASVAVFDVLIEEAKATVSEIVKEGGKAIAMQVDISKLADIDEGIKKTVETFGRLDFVVNAAGIYPKGPAFEQTEENFDKMFAINVKGSFFLARAAAMEMVNEGHGGKIIFFTSTAVYMPVSGVAGPKTTFDASKGAVTTMTRSLASEWARYGIYVNCVLPGPYLKNEVKLKRPDIYFNAQKHTLLKRTGQPEDMADVILFLVSSASDYIDGEEINVDGGYLLCENIEELPEELRT